MRIIIAVLHFVINKYHITKQCICFLSVYRCNICIIKLQVPMTYMYPLHALCGTLGVLDNSLFVVLTAIAVFSLWNNNHTS